jgi:hypothetical protein
MVDYHQRIRQQYQNFHGDSTELFREILMAAEEIGIDEALAYLEQCVIEKRSAWLQANFHEIANENDPLMAGYRWFYEKYLGASMPKDGEIVEHTERRIVMRWWNPCPTLAACQKLGLDTREVCKKAYEKPVQEFLKRVDPRLRFGRNYENIRPHADFCEEIIVLEE